MDNLSDSRQMYNMGWDVEAERLQRHQLGAEITWRYLNRYLPPHGGILEVGFGTGFYTFPLTRCGYRITAIDLADKFVARCKAIAEELDLSNQIDFRVGDARTLHGISRETFDAVLLISPLYHLVLRTDRLAALRSAYACLKSDGVIVPELISRLGILGYLMRDNQSWIENRKSVWSHIRNGRRPLMPRQVASAAISLASTRSLPCMRPSDSVRHGLRVPSQRYPLTTRASIV